MPSDTLKRQYSQVSTETESGDKEPERPLKIARIGKSFRRRQSVISEYPESLVIFGDSYSASFDGEGMTWVDYIRPGRSVQNFAFPGATAEDDLNNQIGRFFATEFPKKHSHPEPSLDPQKARYVLFIGINDCGRTDQDDMEEVIEKIMDAIHRLYTKAGARKFVIMDVPPLSRVPAGVEDEYTLKSRVDTWNEKLNEQISKWARETPKAAVTVFSTHAVFTDILDNPEDFGFEAEDTQDEGGAIWADDLHATSTVHKVIAERFLEQ